MSRRADPVVIRLYRRALWLLPRTFRETRADAMTSMLRDEWRERGWTSRMVLMARAMVDLMWTALVTRLGAEGREREGRMAELWSAAGMDLRSSLRSLARAPLFTMAAILSLAVGIAGVVTVYAVGDGLLLRPISGVSAPQELVEVSTTSLPYPVVQDLAEGLSSLQGLAAHRMRGVALESGLEARLVDAGVVTGNYFSLLGVPAFQGRVLSPTDNVEGAPLVAVLSHALWTEMGASDDVLGTEIRVNGAPFRVVGVAPPGFGGLRLGSSPAFWIPVEDWPAASLGRTPDVHSRNWGWIAGVGRLRPGISLSEASAELRAVSSRIAQEHPESARDLEDMSFMPSRLRAVDAAGEVVRPLLLALAAGVILGLLAAAVNVANLLLARATRRSRELAVRGALGAGVIRLGRLVAIETALLAAAGAGLGLAIAVLSLQGLGSLHLPGGSSFGSPALHLDTRLLALAATTLVAVSLVAGLAPVLAAARISPAGLASDRTSGAGRRSLGLRRLFASLQVAVGIVLLAGASLFGRSILQALDVDLGFEPEPMAVLRVDASLFGDDMTDAGAAVDRLVEEVGGRVGVEEAAWSTVAPLTPDYDSESFEIVGREWTGPRPTAEVVAVGARFVQALGMSLVRGDLSTLGRPTDQPMLVLNETMAARYWPDGDAVGARVVIQGMELPVVAVVADVRFHGFSSSPTPRIFGVLPRIPSPQASIVVRGAGAADVVRSAKTLVRDADTRLVLNQAQTGSQLVATALTPQRTGGLVFLLFAAVALALCLTGVYGVVAYGVSARSKEFGVRLTLGADPARITAEVLRGSLPPLLGGVVVGVAASLVLTRVAAAFLWGVTPRDPWPTAVAAAVVAATTVVATWAPSRKAGQVDPATVLTAE